MLVVAAPPWLVARNMRAQLSIPVEVGSSRQHRSETQKQHEHPPPSVLYSTHPPAAWLQLRPCLLTPEQPPAPRETAPGAEVGGPHR
jgi:hypothetical protein